MALATGPWRRAGSRRSRQQEAATRFFPDRNKEEEEKRGRGRENVGPTCHIKRKIDTNQWVPPVILKVGAECRGFAGVEQKIKALKSWDRLFTHQNKDYCWRCSYLTSVCYHLLFKKIHHYNCTMKTSTTNWEFYVLNRNN